MSLKLQAMKNLIWLISFSIVMPNNATGQGRYVDFITRMLNEHRKKEREFKIISKNAVETGLRQNIINNESFSDIEKYVFIPLITLRESPKNMYNSIDSMSFVMYFDPASISYYEALIIKNDLLIATIEPYEYEKFIAKRLGEYSRLDIQLAEYYIKNEPDLIFTVVNQNGYFIIKGNTISVLVNMGHSLKEYEMNDYLRDFKNVIFDAFRYENKRGMFPFQ